MCETNLHYDEQFDLLRRRDHKMNIVEPSKRILQESTGQIKWEWSKVNETLPSNQTGFNKQWFLNTD